MKYLLSNYWKSINKNKNKKGAKFENLVYDILISEFGNNTFQATPGSWDGSKDFFYYSEREKIWAECKNYSSDITLKILASSMIMAQLSDINTIIIFSYSMINTNAKSKLASSAEHNGERIYFFDDNTLEIKIMQYWKKIGPKYFHQFKMRDEYIKEIENSFPKYETKCIIYGNPYDLSISDEDYKIKQIGLFRMFEINILLISRVTTLQNINITLDNYYNEVKPYFDLYPQNIVDDIKKITLSPFESKIIRLFAVPLNDAKQIFRIRVNSQLLSMPSKIQFRALQTGMVQRLIGKSYEKYCEHYIEKVLSCNKVLKIAVIYGNSGAGKTKLYQECLKLSRINDYEIIDFSNFFLEKDNSITLRDFIEKLLFNIYLIDMDEFQTFLQNDLTWNRDILSKNHIKEFEMLNHYSEITDDNIHNWISKYLEIVALKLAEKKYIIGIDNVQYLNDEIIRLLKELIKKLTLFKECQSKILLTFNTNFFVKQGESIKLFASLIAHSNIVFHKEIKGFRDWQECLEFLQEYIGINKILSINDIKFISEKVDKNPFFMEQLISWLCEMDAISFHKYGCKIENEVKLKNLIHNFPTNIFAILNTRWAYFKSQHSATDESKCVLLFSCLHLYRKIRYQDLEDLQLSDDLIADLVNSCYINMDGDKNQIYIVFYHDLIEDFFSKKIKRFTDKILQFENSNHIIYNRNLIRYYFNKLYNDNNYVITDTALNSILSLHIDARLWNEFYTLLFDRCLNQYVYGYVDDLGSWINQIYRIIIVIHNLLGNEIMVECVNALFMEIHDNIQITTSIEYGYMLLYISEAYDTMGKYHDAIRLIETYKEDVFPQNMEDINNSVLLEQLSYIYNRLHVYKRHIVTNPLENPEIMKLLNDSISIANSMNNKVMQYVNYSDYGYLYYDLPKSDSNSNLIIQNWKHACDTFEAGGTEEKTLNYMRKKAQLNMLNSDSTNAVIQCRQAIEYIENGQYAYQETFFKWWFYHALAESYLINYQPDNAKDIEDALNKAFLYSQLIKSNKLFYYLQIKSVYLYYTDKTEDALTMIEEALVLIEKSNYTLKKQSIIIQLTENISSIKGGGSSVLYSQIQTVDHKFNLPCI